VLLRAVALIRMSSSKQVNSPERQRSLFAAYCERWGLVPVSEYEDLATSATHTKLDDRAGIMAMLADAERGVLNIVWTEEQSRASRDPLETVPIQRHLATLGIPIVENSEDPRQAVLSAERELLTTVRAALSRYEVRQLGARVKRSLRDRMEKGLLCGRLPAGLAWDRVARRYVLDEAGAALPRRAYQLFPELRNVSHVVRQLHAEGTVAPPVRLSPVPH
jgi:DNA invertase Pin-like site-specific DNA recombinase